LYALTPAANFPERMAGWLRQLPTGTLIMVHPGEQSSDSSDISDPIRDARYAELQHLQSLQFADSLQSEGVRLARLSSAI
jgi:hypothetical protein